MAKCKNCKHLYTMYNYKKESFKWCSLIDDCPQEDIERNCENYDPMTNADRIRSMTDEELALAVMCPTEIYFGYEKCVYDESCEECILKWLQRESEE